MIKGIASRGKRRTQGKRRPFEWSVPRFSLKGLDLGARLQAYIDGASSGQPRVAFLLFGFLPARVGIRQVSSFAPQAMPMRRFLSFTRALLSSCVMPPQSQQESVSLYVTTYSARRVPPSVADAAGCSVSERLAVGAWADPAPDGTLQVQARRLAMPVRYSEQRLVIAASIKSRLLKGVCSALSSFSALHPKTRDPHWDDLLRLHPKGDSSHDTIPKPKSLDVTHSDSMHYIGSWVCSRAKVGKVHLAKASVEETPSSSDQPSMHVNVLRPICGKTLADPMSGSGPILQGRKWCYICKPPT